MKKSLLTLVLLLTSFIALSQECVKIDSVYSSIKTKQLSEALGGRDIKFGIKQIAEDELSNKYCLSDKGESVLVEIWYFGIPKTTIRIVGVEQTDQITQVGIRIYYKGKKYEGVGESTTEVKTAFIELTDGKVPFSKTTISSAIKKVIIECVSKMP
jgi:hypothetical protein